MTRINAGIPVEELSDRHLLAEHREIKRIPNMIASGRAKLENIPEKFTLGKGHVKFFYNKLLYLKERYKQLYRESKKRGFNVTNFIGAFPNSDIIVGYKWNDEKQKSDAIFAGNLYNNWTPTPEAIELIRQRIKERNEKTK